MPNKAKAQKLLKMLRPNIARQVRQKSESPTSVDDYCREALYARQHFTQALKKKEAKKNEAERKESYVNPKNARSQAKAKRILIFLSATNVEKSIQKDVEGVQTSVLSVDRKVIMFVNVSIRMFKDGYKTKKNMFLWKFKGEV